MIIIIDQKNTRIVQECEAEAGEMQGNAEVEVMADHLKAFVGPQKSSRVSPDSEYEEISRLLYNDILIVLSSYKNKRSAYIRRGITWHTLFKSTSSASVVYESGFLSL